MTAPPPIAAIVQQCAPDARPKTIAAIIHVESGGNALALLDNTTGQRYDPPDRLAAQKTLSELVSRGHRVDAGLMQIDSENFASSGLNTASVFNACSNIRAGAAILQSSYVTAVTAGYSGQKALFHAFEAYNSGRIDGDAHYAELVLRAAGIPVDIRNGTSTFQPIQQSGDSPRDYASPFDTTWSAKPTLVDMTPSPAAQDSMLTAWRATPIGKSDW